MKNILAILILLTTSITIYAADTVVIGSGLWTVEDGVGSAPDGVTLVDLPIDTPSAYMHEDNNGGVGSTYTLSTTFTTWTTATNSDSTTGITVDEGAGTITIGSDLGGRYVGTFHASIQAPAGKTITMAIFKNNSTLDDIVRTMAAGAEKNPTYRNITSDDGSAVFDTQSSITYLYASDGDDLIGIEAGTGSTRCMDVRVGFENVVRPAYLKVGTSAYQSNNSNHWTNVLMKNYSTGLHVDVNALTKDFEDVGAAVEPFERVSWKFQVPSPVNQYVSGNTSEALFQHNDVSCSSSHKMHIDEAKIVETFSSAAVAFPVEFSVSGGDVLRLKLKANETDVDAVLSDYGLNVFKIGL